MDKLLLVMERAKGVFKDMGVDGYRARSAELNIIDIGNREDFAKLNIQPKDLSDLEKCVLHLLLVGLFSKEEIALRVGRAETTITGDVLSRGLFRYTEIIAKIPERRINHDNFRTFLESHGYRKTKIYVVLAQDIEDTSVLDKIKKHGFKHPEIIYIKKEGGHENE